MSLMDELFGRVAVFGQRVPMDREYLRPFGPPNALPLGGGPFYVNLENQPRKEGAMRKKPEIGDAIVYHNEKGVGHNGLITCVWGDHMINIVYVSSNDSQKDDYGRQTIRESSVPMKGDGEFATQQCAHGRYARYPDETPVPYATPQAV